MTEDDRWAFEVVIAAQRCVRYTMPTPSFISGYPWDRANLQPHIHVQLEPDLRIHLVPDTASGPVEVGEFVARQTSGFPLASTDQAC
jgi:hypothetical protein